MIEYTIRLNEDTQCWDVGYNRPGQPGLFVPTITGMSMKTALEEMEAANTFAAIREVPIWTEDRVQRRIIRTFDEEDD